MKDEADFGDDMDVLCPDCAPQAEFFRPTCPGCVEIRGYRCSFWRLFAFGKHSRCLSSDERLTVLNGRCPARGNGTFGMDAHTGQVFDLDIPDQASSSAGAAVLAAVVAYVAKYPVGEGGA